MSTELNPTTGLPFTAEEKFIAEAMQTASNRDGNAKMPSTLLNETPTFAAADFGTIVDISKVVPFKSRGTPGVSPEYAAAAEEAERLRLNRKVEADRLRFIPYLRALLELGAVSYERGATPSKIGEAMKLSPASVTYVFTGVDGPLTHGLARGSLAYAPTRYIYWLTDAGITHLAEIDSKK